MASFGPQRRYRFFELLLLREVLNYLSLQCLVLLFFAQNESCSDPGVALTDPEACWAAIAERRGFLKPVGAVFNRDRWVIACLRFVSGGRPVYLLVDYDDDNDHDQERDVSEAEPGGEKEVDTPGRRRYGFGE